MGNKFGAVKVISGDGIKFDSKKEMNYRRILENMKHAVIVSNRVDSYEMQVRFDILVNGYNCGFYKLDFLVKYADGRIRYIDVKGLKKGSAYAMFRLKKKLVEALYNIKIEEV
jgi:hypothetical protein